MVKAGEVYAIQTSKGEAYFQFVKKLRLMGSLIRVFPLDSYAGGPPDWNDLVQQETNFWTFFP